MASLTIRKLDEAVKAYLRVRSAGNGRSVEEEVRVILGELIQRAEFPGATVSPLSAEAPAQASQPISTAGEPNVTLIIGGGIAAFKSLELIRRLKERHIQVRCVLTKAAQQFITPLSASALSHERVYTDLFDAESEFDAGHIRLGRMRRQYASPMVSVWADAGTCPASTSAWLRSASWNPNGPGQPPN